ncbi:hypothetical protein BJY01DRAFT_224415 [Aspergillus pseudoustus]|uniref:F-box domain-containing protein n=1 Tax=Aspergillus pseudoustus TaxID=1810923 RepID=A0ABR4J288_9EURO
MSATTLDSLPSEIIVHIVIQLVGCDPRIDSCAYVYDPVPSALCLVSRRWKQIVTPLLYANYSYNSHPDKVDSLWRYARTVVNHPNLARKVRQVDFTTRELRHPHSFSNRVGFLRHLRDLYTANESWITRAYKQVGWDRPYYQNAFFTHCRDALESCGDLPDTEDQVALET